MICSTLQRVRERFVRPFARVERLFIPHALTYYRYAWAVQDIAAYGERVFFLPGLGKETRWDVLRGFLSLFEPGNIVDTALESVLDAA